MIRKENRKYNLTLYRIDNVSAIKIPSTVLDIKSQGRCILRTRITAPKVMIILIALDTHVWKKGNLYCHPHYINDINYLQHIVSFTKQTIYILKLIYYNYCQF
jgi:hypothetical protein